MDLKYRSLLGKISGKEEDLKDELKDGWKS